MARLGRVQPFKPHYGRPPAVPLATTGRLSRPASLDGLGGVGQLAFNPLLSLLVLVASVCFLPVASSLGA